MYFSSDCGDEQRRRNGNDRQTISPHHSNHSIVSENLNASVNSYAIHRLHREQLVSILSKPAQDRYSTQAQDIQIISSKGGIHMPTRLLEFRSLFKAVIALLALTGAISVHAQVTTGTVRGEVTDQAGAVVPGATVTITDPKTKTSQTAQSGNGGEYQFNNLLVGTYVITVAAAVGFQLQYAHAKRCASETE